MNHTPGPWHCNGQTVYGPLTDGDRDYICTCGDVVHDEHAANARLIAAAPELLAALTAVEARLTSVARAFYVDGKQKALQSAFQGWKDDITPARSALAKASVLPRNF